MTTTKIVVWKHPLTAMVNRLRLAAGAKVIHFGEQGGMLYLWEAHEAAAREVADRVFEIVATGDPALVDPARHVGTVVHGADDLFVFHLFETAP
jgi:hypothetical protein